MSPKVWFRAALTCVALMVVGLLAGPRQGPPVWAADADNKLEKKLTIQDRDSGFEMKFVLVDDVKSVFKAALIETRNPRKPVRGPRRLRKGAEATV